MQAVRRFAAWIAVCIWLSLSGCNDSSATNSAEQPGKAPASASTSGPAEAVYQFLKAVQSGDDKQAASMLTKLALEKTEAMDLAVAPPGSDTASFEVGEVEMIQEDGAYVASTWTDLENGQQRSDQIVWVLRREPEGWRIAGMVTRLFDNKLVLNFEDPEDMIRKQKLAEEEMMRRAEQDLQQAKPAATGNEPIRR